jgi:hypothetical protein
MSRHRSAALIVALVAFVAIGVGALIGTRQASVSGASTGKATEEGSSSGTLPKDLNFGPIDERLQKAFEYYGVRVGDPCPEPTADGRTPEIDYEAAGFLQPVVDLREPKGECRIGGFISSVSDPIAGKPLAYDNDGVVIPVGEDITG